MAESEHQILKRLLDNFNFACEQVHAKWKARCKPFFERYKELESALWEKCENDVKSFDADYEAEIQELQKAYDEECAKESNRIRKEAETKKEGT